MRIAKLSAAWISTALILFVVCATTGAAGAAGTTAPQATAPRPAGATSAAKTAAASAQQSAQGSLVTRVHDTGFVQLTADSFDNLTPDQKMDAYWLSMAAIAVNPIAYDQNSAY